MHADAEASAGTRTGTGTALCCPYLCHGYVTALAFNHREWTWPLALAKRHQKRLVLIVRGYSLCLHYSYGAVQLQLQNDSGLS